MKKFSSRLNEITQAKADALRSIKNISKTNPKNRLKAIAKARETIAKADKNATRRFGVHARGDVPHQSKHLGKLPTNLKDKLIQMRRKRERIQASINAVKSGEKKLNAKQVQALSSKLNKINAELGMTKSSVK